MTSPTEIFALLEKVSQAIENQTVFLSSKEWAKIQTGMREAQVIGEMDSEQATLLVIQTLLEIASLKAHFSQELQPFQASGRTTKLTGIARQKATNDELTRLQPLINKLVNLKPAVPKRA